MGWISDRLRGFVHASHGFSPLLAEANSKLHALATIVVVALAWALGVSREDWLWLCAAIFGVWVAEAFNTAIEHTCNAVAKREHPSIRHAKDVAAAAVLLASLFALVVGVLVLGPHLWSAWS